MKSVCLFLTTLILSQSCLANPVADREPPIEDPSIFIQKMLDAFSGVFNQGKLDDISDFSDFSNEEVVVMPASGDSSAKSDQEFVSDAMQIIQQIFGNPFEGSKKVVIFQQLPPTGGQISIKGNGEASFVNKYGDDSAKEPANDNGIVVKYSETHGKAIPESYESVEDSEESYSQDSEYSVSSSEEKELEEDDELDREEELAEEEEIAEEEEEAAEELEADRKKSSSGKKVDTRNHSFEFDETEEDDFSMESEENEDDEQVIEEINPISKDSLEEAEGLRVKDEDKISNLAKQVKDISSNIKMKVLEEQIAKRIEETFDEDSEETPEVGHDENESYLWDFFKYFGF